MPEPEATVFRLRVIDKPYKTPDKISYRWGMVATPVKPYPEEYRSIFFFQYGNFGNDLIDNSETVKQFKSVLGLAKAMGVTHFEIFSWNKNFMGQPLLEDQKQIDDCRRANEIIKAYGFKPIFYSGWNAGNPKMKMWPFFGEQMIRRPTRFSYTGYFQCARGGYESYLANGIAWMIKTLGVEGVYLDSTSWAVPCNDAHHGCGYIDSKTGERRITRCIWHTREMFKRIYKILHGEVIADGMLYNHAGQSPLMAIESFIDVKHCGEGAYHVSSLKKFFDIDLYRAAYNGKQYGWPIEHTWNDRAAIARNSVWGLGLLHDNVIKMYSTSVIDTSLWLVNYEDKRGIDWKMWAPKQWFQWKDYTWHPYYDNGDVLSVSDSDGYGSFHVNEKKQMLFCAVNLAQEKKTIEFKFNVKQLKLPEIMYARDVVTDEDFQIKDGAFSLDILGERPRILMIDTKPVPAIELKLPTAP